MLAYHFIDPNLKVEKGDNKIRGQWCGNSGLKHLPHTSTWHSGKFEAESLLFFVTKKNSF